MKKYTNEELEELWEKLGEVLVNNRDEIESEFLKFPIGTHREEIWHWFDERYEGGVIYLQFT